MKYIKNELTGSNDDCDYIGESDGNMRDPDKEIIDEDYDEEESKETAEEYVNSYTSDNNTNNDNELATESEESDERNEEILTQKVLDAIIELTKAVNVNNEIVGKQNELMAIKLNSLDAKLDALKEAKMIPEANENIFDLAKGELV